MSWFREKHIDTNICSSRIEHLEEKLKFFEMKERLTREFPAWEIRSARQNIYNGVVVFEVSKKSSDSDGFCFNVNSFYTFADAYKCLRKLELLP